MTRHVTEGGEGGNNTLLVGAQPDKVSPSPSVDASSRQEKDVNGSRTGHDKERKNQRLKV